MFYVHTYAPPFLFRLRPSPLKQVRLTEKAGNKWEDDSDEGGDVFSGFDDAAAAAMFADLMHGNIPAGFAEGGGGGGGDGGGGGGARGRSAGTGTGFRGRSYDSDDSSTDSDYYDKGDVRNHLCVCGVRNLGAAHPPVLTFTAHEDGGVLLPCTRMQLLCVYVFMGI